MRLKSLEYEEFVGQPRHWSLSEAEFSSLNLLVGRNATGKSRTISIILSLAKVLMGNVKPLFISGSWNIQLEDGEKSYLYHIEFLDKTVQSERFECDGKVLLQRQVDGSGKIYSAEFGRQMSLGVSPTDVAAVVKRDSAQHPFLEILHTWADSVRFFPFGSDIGRTNIWAVPYDTPESNMNTPAAEASASPEKITELYSRAYQELGEEYDQAILSGLRSVGYECSDVSADRYSEVSIPGAFAIMLKVKEVDLDDFTWAVAMSSGMFRVLALLVHLYYYKLSARNVCILIDDIGEGLDFQRSKLLIDLILSEGDAENIQIIFSSNNEFIMDEVDLRLWHVLQRSGGEVHILDYKNSKERFDEFRDIGLNNFDFFAYEISEKSSK